MLSRPEMDSACDCEMNGADKRADCGAVLKVLVASVCSSVVE